MGILSHLHLPGGHPIDGLGLKPPKTYGIHPHPESKRKLDYYIKTNHVNNSFLFNDKEFHNHIPHTLIAAYFLGATPEQLDKLYKVEVPELTLWSEEKSSKEITDDNYTEFLGNKNYTRSYFDYFSTKIKHTDLKHDWKEVARDYFIDGKSINLMSGVFGGLIHPLIHLGYAVEDGSPLVAIEALSMTCVEYFDFEKLLNFGDTGNGISQPEVTKDPLQILTEIRDDQTFDDQFKVGYIKQNIPILLDKFRPQVKYYSKKLDTSDPKETIKRLLHCGAMLTVASHKPNEPAFDFFLLHVLTASQSLAEIILSKPGAHIFPPEVQPKLLQQLWTIIVSLYITSLRPAINPARIPAINKPIDELWKDTIDKTLNGPKMSDEHLAKATRAFLITELLLEDHTGLYARAANHFASNRPDSEPYAISRLHMDYAGFPDSTRTLDIKL